MAAAATTLPPGTRSRAFGGVPAERGWQRKDVAEWSNPEVRTFIESILPGHDCAGTFLYASGRVLCSLTKEDLRRQVRDEEAANVIWGELQRLQEACREREEVAAHSSGLFSLFVRTPAEVSLELEVLPTDMVGDVKERIASLEGTPAEMQRLTRNGLTLLDTRTLGSYGLSHGTVLLLVPRLALAGQKRFAPMPAAWNSHLSTASSGIPRPRMPVVCSDIARPFPMSLEFSSVPEYQGFMLSLQRQVGRRDLTTASPEADANAPFLEILPADNTRRPVRTRINFDPEAEVLLVDTLGDIVIDCARYRVLLHLREERKTAHLVTGPRIER